MVRKVFNDKVIKDVKEIGRRVKKRKEKRMNFLEGLSMNISKANKKQDDVFESEGLGMGLWGDKKRKGKQPKERKWI